MLKRHGRRWGLQRSETVEFQFRRRYGLTPRDPRFLELTAEEILVDHWAHLHVEHPKLRDEEINEYFDEDLAEMEAEAGVPPEPPPADPSDFETVTDDRWGL